ncbi:PBP2_TRAP_Siap_TeaA_like [Peptoniphilus sp. ING2-D1G]|nr:PBP2_TRAP_Siap_TeaA_like [Peptoniphilus sp. ING2-D1G]
MNRKTIFSILMLVLLISTLTACKKKGEDEKYTLRIGTTLAPNHALSQGAEYFAKRMDELTDGKVEVWTFPGASLGGEKQMLESMMAGGLDFAIITQSPLTNWIPEMRLVDLPFLFHTEEEVDYILGGEIGNHLFSYLPDYGLYGYGWAENGFRQITNSKRPVKVPADLDGMLIRTMENPLMMDAVSSWGGSPTPLPTGEIYTALQQGTVDGQENPTNQIISQKYYEAQKYLTYTNHFYSPCIFYGSKARIDKLPEDIQEDIKIAAAEACEFQRELSRKQMREADAEMDQYLECYTPTPEELQLWIDASAPTYENYASDIGKDVIDRTQELLKEFRENGGKQ